ncbi:triphosphoribosyl-dephospho-CoA synthase, partial [Pseudomonas aeruginosa]|uniref:triphosphoribosyl-dephospho-CoA synthase n=1 Tax=Pseudomonas aeruginosa TaxID=287 RepID=UPI0021566B80
LLKQRPSYVFPLLPGAWEWCIRDGLGELDRRLLALNASPGGAADLLAACLFLDRLPAVSGGWAGSL